MSDANPYIVLGIDPSATDDEVKATYRELAKKYHPDNYTDNPLSNLAQEKMQEINQAYDAIVHMRQRGNAGPQASYGSTRYHDIRNMIRAGRVLDAETLLDGIPGDSRDAEWFFLKGSVLYKKGWLDDAYNHFATAAHTDPTNVEYRQAFEHLSMNRRTGGYHRTAGNAGGGCSGCDICAGLLCADCCCRCMCH